MSEIRDTEKLLGELHSPKCSIKESSHLIDTNISKSQKKQDNVDPSDNTIGKNAAMGKNRTDEGKNFKSRKFTSKTYEERAKLLGCDQFTAKSDNKYTCECSGDKQIMICTSCKIHHLIQHQQVIQS